MEGEERNLFENSLKENPVLKQQVEDIRDLILGIERGSLQEKMDTFHEEITADDPAPKSRPEPIKFNFRKYAIAATVAILIGVTSFFYITAEDQNEKIFDDFFIPDPGLATTMSTESNYDFYEAMVNYKRANYDLAITQWNMLHEKKPENDTLNYFLGVAHLANNQIEPAIEFLSKVSEQKDSDFIEDTYYYLGLAHLKAGDLETAKFNLNQSRVVNAQIVLKELDK